MPPLTRLLFLVTTLLILFFLFFYLSLSTIPLAARPSLFPRSAIISLTDDNSTFFLARPAAFGPQLPGESLGGLTGRLFVVEEGEFGCGDEEGDGEGVPVQLDDWWGTNEAFGEEDVIGGVDKDAFWNRRRHGHVEDAVDVAPLPSPDSEAILSAIVMEHEKVLATLSEVEGGSESEISTLSPLPNLPLSSEFTLNSPQPQLNSLNESSPMAGRIVLVERGGCGFLAKVMWAQRRGALALIVGDHEKGRPLLTMYARGDTSNVTIPSLFTTYTTAHFLISLLPPDSSHHNSSNPGLEKELTNGAVHSGRDGNGARPGDGADRSEGLWLTLAATRGPTSPFFDTLLVLVISPLVTLGVVYVMLTLRASIQRRRWRAPKSVVDSFPVRTYIARDLPPGYVHTTEREREIERERREREEATLTVPTRKPGDDDPAQPSPSPTQIPTAPVLVIPESLPPSTPPKPESHSHPFSSTTIECVICLEDYVPNVSRVMRLPCGHDFHVGCITPWLVTRRRTCPICKCDVVKSRSGGSSDRADSSGAGAGGADGEEDSDLESAGPVGIVTYSDDETSSESSSGSSEGGFHRDRESRGSIRGLSDWRRIFGGIGLGLDVSNGRERGRRGVVDGGGQGLQASRGVMEPLLSSNEEDEDEASPLIVGVAGAGARERNDRA